MSKSKKSAPAKYIINLILLAGLLGLMVYTYPCPLASGKAIIIKKTVYVRDVTILKFTLYLLGGLGVILFFYSLIRSKFFWPGMICLALSGWMFLVWSATKKQIADNAVSLLGIDPLSIVSTRPEIGLSLMGYIGVVAGLMGFIYLIEALISHFSRS